VLHTVSINMSLSAYFNC